MGCGVTCAKWGLLLFNLLIWIVGIVLIAVGMVVIVQSDKYSYLFDGNENTLATAAGIVIGTGCVIFLVGFCACCGAIKQVVCLLQAYFVLIVIIIILEVTAAILAFVYRDGLSAIVGDTIEKTIINEYTEEEEDHPGSRVIDKLQKEFKCCGRSEYTDWENSKWYETQTAQAQQYRTPKSCCRGDPKKNPDCNIGRNGPPGNIHEKGCGQEFEDWFNSNYVTVAVICLAMVLFQIMALVFTCCLIGEIKERSEVV